MSRQRFGHSVRETMPVDSQGAARRNLIGVRRAHDDRIAAPHFVMQQADSIIFAIVGAERVGADKLGAAIGLVRLGWLYRTHFMQGYGDAGFGELPCRFAAGEAAAYDMNGFHPFLSLTSAATCIFTI